MKLEVVPGTEGQIFYIYDDYSNRAELSEAQARALIGDVQAALYPSNHHREPEFYTLQVWLPGSHPGENEPTFTLENSNALQCLLEGLAHGNSVIQGDEPFDVVCFRGNDEVGRGTYQIHFIDVGDLATMNDPEPIKLQVLAESGQWIGIMQSAWINMVASSQLFESEFDPE
jgi:hypothetical protein